MRGDQAGRQAHAGHAALVVCCHRLRSSCAYCMAQVSAATSWITRLRFSTPARRWFSMLPRTSTAKASAAARSSKTMKVVDAMPSSLLVHDSAEPCTLLVARRKTHSPIPDDNKHGSSSVP